MSTWTQVAEAEKQKRVDEYASKLRRKIDKYRRFIGDRDRHVPGFAVMSREEYKILVARKVLVDEGFVDISDTVLYGVPTIRAHLHPVPSVEDDVSGILNTIEKGAGSLPKRFTFRYLRQEVSDKVLQALNNDDRFKGFKWKRITPDDDPIFIPTL